MVDNFNDKASDKTPEKLLYYDDFLDCAKKGESNQPVCIHANSNLNTEGSTSRLAYRNHVCWKWLSITIHLIVLRLIGVVFMQSHVKP